MKWAIYIGGGLGGLIGGYLPVLFWNADPMDMTSLTWGFIGTIIGLIVGVKAGKYLGD